MNTYELTVVLPEDKEGKEVAKLVKTVTDFVKKAKGEVNKQESWGARHMAYMIKKQTVANYEHFVLTLESAKAIELDKMLKMDESLLRYMIVRV
jgi:small subunit ribosomal protein S6